MRQKKGIRCEDFSQNLAYLKTHHIDVIVKLSLHYSGSNF